MTTLMSETKEFETWDGVRLFYRVWPVAKDSRRNIVLFHGGHEHSGRFSELVERLGQEKTTYFAWDARGHGHSPGERGYAESIHDITRDLDCFIKHLSREHGLSLSDTVFLGHSVGSLTALSYICDYRPNIRGMVLVSPALHVRTYVPFDRALLRLLIRLNPKGHVNSYVVARMLTHDKAEIKSRENDPLISRPIGTKMLLSVLEEGERLIQKAPDLKIPTLILSAGNDWVVHLSAERDFFNRLGTSKKEKEMIVCAGFFHEVFHEKEREVPIKKAREFILSLFEGNDTYESENL